jgi:hypothetical protein
MMLSRLLAEADQPWLTDYRPFLDQLEGSAFPACSTLNAMLADGLESERGQAIRFVPSTELDDSAYEQRIYDTGIVSTRPDNFHDFFNALVWMRFPQIKIAMNTLHNRGWIEQESGRRGKIRDALTLFDECGVIVFSRQAEFLTLLAERRWADAFLDPGFRQSVQLSVCGHAMLEKYLSPYKAMTAKALLVKTGEDFTDMSRAEVLDRLDKEISSRILDGSLMSEPACLSPLPLAGVPGWWPQSEQAQGTFYTDHKVFRPLSPALAPASVISL